MGKIIYGDYPRNSIPLGADPEFSHVGVIEIIRREMSLALSLNPSFKVGVHDQKTKIWLEINDFKVGVS